MFVVQCQRCYGDGAQRDSVGGVQGRTSGCRERESRKELVLCLEKERIIILLYTHYDIVYYCSSLS